MMKYSIRKLNRSDMPKVMQIQQSAYPSALWEDRDLFEHKLRLFPAGCLGLVMSQSLSGYLFCHPWKVNHYIPLNTTTISLPSDADTLYIHDLAVFPQLHNLGIGRYMIDQAFTFANFLHLKFLTLVAVNNSTQFWAKFGFQIYKKIQYTIGIEGVVMSCETLKEN